jgi:hypothetical protein
MVENIKDIKPKAVTFKDKVKEDKSFLLALIDDPVKAFIAYGFHGDEKMLGMVNAMSANIRERAILMFSEVLKSETGDGCDGCRSCFGCGSAEANVSQR